MDPRSQKAAELAAGLLYGDGYDFAVKLAVRFQHSLEELLEHKQIDPIWKSIATPAAAVPVEDEALTSEMTKTASLAALVSAESMSKLQQPGHADQLQAVESAAETARKAVRSQVQTVNGAQSLQRLAKELTNLEILKLRGTSESSVLVIYSVESAGEHLKDARRSPTPHRKEHLDKVLKAVMATRGDTLPDFENDSGLILPPLDPSDV